MINRLHYLTVCRFSALEITPELLSDSILIEVILNEYSPGYHINWYNSAIEAQHFINSVTEPLVVFLKIRQETRMNTRRNILFIN